MPRNNFHTGLKTIITENSPTERKQLIKTARCEVKPSAALLHLLYQPPNGRRTAGHDGRAPYNLGHASHVSSASCNTHVYERGESFWGSVELRRLVYYIREKPHYTHVHAHTHTCKCTQWHLGYVFYVYIQVYPHSTTMWKNAVRCWFQNKQAMSEIADLWWSHVSYEIPRYALCKFKIYIFSDLPARFYW